MQKVSENQQDVMPDTLVWALLKGGDNRSVDILLSRYFRPMLHYGSRFTKDRFLVEDVIQDLFLEFLEKRTRLGDPVSIKNYLFKCLRNNLIRELKTRGMTEEVEGGEEVFVDFDNMERFLIGIDESEELVSKMKQYFSFLTARQKECLFLRYYQDQTNEEIAAIMGINKQSVSNLLLRSIAVLRENWVFETFFLFCNLL